MHVASYVFKLENRLSTNYVVAIQQEKEQCETLRTESVSQSDKLQQCKAKLQSLTEDVMRLTEENSSLNQCYDLENIKVKAASSVADKSVSRHSEAEWKSLEQCMKVHMHSTYVYMLK